MPRQSRDTAEDAEMRYSAAYPTGAERIFRSQGLGVRSQGSAFKMFNHVDHVDYDGFCVGEYFVDLYVNDCLVVELKSTAALAPEHLAQLINYLKIMDKSVGLLVNFGSRKFERRTVYR